MRLHPVPAATGYAWLKLGMQTFVRQPMALIGLFFLYMAAVSLVSLVPLVGDVLAMALVPCATLGLMAGSLEASEGRFPKPSLLIMGLRSGAPHRRNMLILGALYAAAVALVFVTAPSFPAERAEAGVTPEMVAALLSSPRLFLAFALYVPVLMLFWHAPALVHWHGVSPAASLFFSFMACWRNKGALLVYAISWMALMSMAGMVLSLLAAALGGAQAMAVIIYPVGMLLAAVFHSSIYFTYRDSFDSDEPPTDTPQLGETP